MGYTLPTGHSHGGRRVPALAAPVPAAGYRPASAPRRAYEELFLSGRWHPEGRWRTFTQPRLRTCAATRCGTRGRGILPRTARGGYGRGRQAASDTSG